MEEDRLEELEKEKEHLLNKFNNLRRYVVDKKYIN